MKFTETPLLGSYLIDIDPIEDERGFFSRFFCKSEFEKLGLNTNWVQINNSMNKEIATLRGLHFQRPPSSEVKLVRCISGEIFDVIVDIRTNSSSFGKWFGKVLSNENRTMMYVPKGFAHGFISLKPNSEILYLVSEFYEPSAEESIHWNDPSLNISWPIAPNLVSKKDSAAKFLSEIKMNEGNFKI